jgi:uncharacterized membrane protein
MFAFFAYMFVLNDYDLDIKGLITLSLAVFNAVVLIILYGNRQIDRNLIYLIIAIVLSFVSLAIPIQLKGHVITLFWAAESVILLLLWQKSRIMVFYVGFFLILLMTVFSYIMDINNLNFYSDHMTVVANRLFITGIVVIAAFVINMLLLRRESQGGNDKSQLVGIFTLVIIALAYIVPFIELNIQLQRYTDVAEFEGLFRNITSFRYVVLAVFTTIYIAVLGIIYNKKVSSKNYIFYLLYFSVIIYAIFFSNLFTELRYDLFYIGAYPASYFSIHLLALPAIAYIIFLTTKNVANKKVWLSWLLTILVVVILSVETDHLAVWAFGNKNNYGTVLHDVHTFGYPILWGIIAMVLMIWGLNRKEALLRKISIVFFGLIIVKFYAYDVWNMSQSGRIISFVLLGVILLLVSFLQQKIRTLVRSDEKVESDALNDPNELQR